MITLIICCEIGFWVCLAIGLVARYLLRAQRLSMAILLGAPALDVALLLATAVSLSRGAPPETGHAIAAIYLGFSVAYGHRLIKWADVRFAHRFDGGPAPEKLAGAAYTKRCWGTVGQTGLAAAIACATTVGLTTVTEPGVDTAALSRTYQWMAIAFVAEVIWAVSYTIWPRPSAASGRLGASM